MSRQDKFIQVVNPQTAVIDLNELGDDNDIAMHADDVSHYTDSVETFFSIVGHQQLRLSGKVLRRSEQEHSGSCENCKNSFYMSLSQDSFPRKEMFTKFQKKGSGLFFRVLTETEFLDCFNYSQEASLYRGNDFLGKSCFSKTGQLINQWGPFKDLALGLSLVKMKYADANNDDYGVLTVGSRKLTIITAPNENMPFIYSGQKELRLSLIMRSIHQIEVPRFTHVFLPFDFSKCSYMLLFLGLKTPKEDVAKLISFCHSCRYLKRVAVYQIENDKFDNFRCVFYREE
jgi:hypothetical protein